MAALHRIVRTLAACGMLTAAVTMGGCARGEKLPSTEAERLAYGRDIVERMSATLAAAQTLSVKATEVRDEITPKDEPRRVALTRESEIRRPDRLHTKVTGDRTREVWYDGIGVTVVVPDDKVFAQARMPETLDKTLDAMQERYGIGMPLADFVYSQPAKALLSDTTTGGWVAREGRGDAAVDHLAFKDQGVSWDIWVPVTGDPLPKRIVVETPDDAHTKKVEATITSWTLGAPVADAVFTPVVPPDYEGVAMLQRARVLRNIPADTPDAAAPKADDTGAKPQASK